MGGMPALSKKPVQGHFGELDAMAGFSDPDTGLKLQGDLREAGNAQAEVFIYPGVGHAFMNPSSAPYASFEDRQADMGFPGFNAEQSDLAWGRWVTCHAPL